MRELEFWVRKSGDIAETERNPCGCCRNDYHLTHKATIIDKVKTVYLGAYSEKGLAAYMNKLGYEKLEEPTIEPPIYPCECGGYGCWCMAV